jgi:hypothetical protein
MPSASLRANTCKSVCVCVCACACGERRAEGGGSERVTGSNGDFRAPAAQPPSHRGERARAAVNALGGKGPAYEHWHLCRAEAELKIHRRHVRRVHCRDLALVIRHALRGCVAVR